MSKYTFDMIANIIDNLALPVEDQREVRKAIASQFAKTLQANNPNFNKLVFMRAATNNPAK